MTQHVTENLSQDDATNFELLHQRIKDAENVVREHQARMKQFLEEHKHAITGVRPGMRYRKGYSRPRLFQIVEVRATSHRTIVVRAEIVKKDGTLGAVEDGASFSTDSTYWELPSLIRETVVAD